MTSGSYPGVPVPYLVKRIIEPHLIGGGLIITYNAYHCDSDFPLWFSFFCGNSSSEKHFCIFFFKFDFFFKAQLLEKNKSPHHFTLIQTKQVINSLKLFQHSLMII